MWADSIAIFNMIVILWDSNISILRHTSVYNSADCNGFSILDETYLTAIAWTKQAGTVLCQAQISLR